jgi:glycosyltransferase involved in cell wall biosynthesis
MKELCIDVRMAFNSGIGTYIRNLVKQLQKGPFKLRLIADEKSVEKWPLLKECDLILTSAPLYSIEEQLKLPFLIPSCDLFWSPHYNVPLGPIRAKKRVVTIHDVYHLAYGKTLSLPKRTYAKIVINRATTLSDLILTDSYFSQDEIVKYTAVAKDKIQVVHLGVDHDRFRELKDETYLQSIREKYQLPQNYFLFVSTLAPHKNIDRLLLAWNELKKPDWKLVFVGRQVKNNTWKTIVDQNPSLADKLLFLGEFDDRDLPALYQLAHATICPSLYEGFGLPPLEAMSSGCPVVVSNAASLPEVCGKSAVYVDPYSVDDIASGIRRMIEDQNLYASLKQAGLDRSREFTWDKTAKKHIEIMDNML